LIVPLIAALSCPKTLKLRLAVINTDKVKERKACPFPKQA